MKLRDRAFWMWTNSKRLPLHIFFIILWFPFEIIEIIWITFLVTDGSQELSETIETIENYKERLTEAFDDMRPR